MTKMTVTEMIAELQKVCDSGYSEALVVKSTDDEGNGYSKVSSVSLSLAVTRGGYIELVHPDDVDWYDSSELNKVLCVW